MGSRPDVVAHRGASWDVAEHTFKAYLAALEAGVEGLECDVRLTADGHLVCAHDRDLRRTASRRGVISTMDLADLEELDFASWKNPWGELDDEAPEPDANVDGLLTLRKLLEHVADLDRRVEVAIETKHPTRYSGLVERRLCEMLTDFGWDKPGSPVRVMSFSFAALQRFERLCPDVRLVQLIDKPRHWKVLKRAIGEDWIVGPGMELLNANPELGPKIARSGHEMHVWVVNTPADLRRCQDLGVTTVITDRPAYLLALLDQDDADAG